MGSIPHTVMMASSGHHSITPVIVIGRHRLTEAGAPLNGRAVLRAEATQGRTHDSAMDGGAGTGGQERRRPPSDRPSGKATPTD